MCDDRIKHIVNQIIYNSKVEDKLVYEKVDSMNCTFQVIKHKSSQNDNYKRVISVSLWKRNLGYVYNLSVALLSWKKLRNDYWSDFTVRIYVDISVFTNVVQKLWDKYEIMIKQQINLKILCLFLLGSDKFYESGLMAGIQSSFIDFARINNKNRKDYIYIYTQYSELLIFRNIIPLKPKNKLNFIIISKSTIPNIYKFIYAYINEDIKHDNLLIYFNIMIKTGYEELMNKYFEGLTDENIYDKIYNHFIENKENLIIIGEIYTQQKFKENGSFSKNKFIEKLKNTQKKLIDRINSIDLYDSLFRYLYKINNEFKVLFKTDEYKESIYLFREYIRKYNILVKNYMPLLEEIYKKIDYNNILDGLDKYYNVRLDDTIYNNIIDYINNIKNNITDQVKNTDAYKTLVYKKINKEDVDWYPIFYNLVSDPNFEIWLYNCNWAIDKNCMHINTFGSLIRCQPIIDKNVEICIIRNLELLTSALDRQYYDDWNKSGATIFNYSFSYICKNVYKDVCSKNLKEKVMFLASSNIKKTDWFKNNKVDEKMWNCIKYLFHNKFIKVNNSLISKSMEILSDNQNMPENFYNFHFGVDEVVLTVCLQSQVEDFMKNINIDNPREIINACEICLVDLYSGRPDENISRKEMIKMLTNENEVDIKFDTHGMHFNNIEITKLYAIYTLQLINKKDIDRIFKNFSININDIESIYNYEIVYIRQIFPAYPFKNKSNLFDIKKIHKSLRFYLQNKIFKPFEYKYFKYKYKYLSLKSKI